MILLPVNTEARLEFWLFVAGLAAAAAYSFWYGFKAWGKNRTIIDTPTARVRSAAQGYVELTGWGCMPPQPPITGPLTGIPCTWWSYKIEEREGSVRSRSWIEIDSGTSETPFLLDDGTGQCLIDPRGAEVVPHTRDVWYGPEAWPRMRIPPGKGILGRLADSLLSGGRYRYIERRLHPREPLYAIGEFRSLGGVSPEDADDAITALLHDWKRDQATLIARFDANRDGVIDADEWERVRAAARQEVLAKRSARPELPGTHVLAEPADGRAYLLAAYDEESLARRFRRQALLSIGFFVAASAALAWMLTRVA